MLLLPLLHRATPHSILLLALALSIHACTLPSPTSFLSWGRRAAAASPTTFRHTQLFPGLILIAIIPPPVPATPPQVDGGRAHLPTALPLLTPLHTVYGVFWVDRFALPHK